MSSMVYVGAAVAIVLVIILGAMIAKRRKRPKNKPTDTPDIYPLW